MNEHYKSILRLILGEGRFFARRRPEPMPAKIRLT
jgi:hypothetical protein